MSYIHYPRPHMTSQYYSGFSIETGYIWAIMLGPNGLSSWYLAPKLFYGKEFLSSKKKRRFWEIFIGGQFAFDHAKYTSPMFGFKYGFIF